MASRAWDAWSQRGFIDFVGPQELPAPSRLTPHTCSAQSLLCAHPEHHPSSRLQEGGNSPAQCHHQDLPACPIGAMHPPKHLETHTNSLPSFTRAPLWIVAPHSILPHARSSPRTPAEGTHTPRQISGQSAGKQVQIPQQGGKRGPPDPVTCSSLGWAMSWATRQRSW